MKETVNKCSHLKPVSPEAKTRKDAILTASAPSQIPMDKRLPGTPREELPKWRQEEMLEDEGHEPAGKIKIATKGVQPTKEEREEHEATHVPVLMCKLRAWKGQEQSAPDAATG